MPTHRADRVDSYLVCATPRTGSSLLLNREWITRYRTAPSDR